MNSACAQDHSNIPSFQNTYVHIDAGATKPFSILHITAQDRFSPTATQYVVGGNFLFHGQEVTFA